MSKLRSPISKIVNEISDIPITGNIIPNSWWAHIRRGSTNKPYDQAIIILADIIYWYRKQEIRDEVTGHTIGFKQKFAADKLQRSYESYAKQFGYSKKQVRCAIAHLVSNKILTTEFRTLNTGTTVLNNVLYVEPNPQKIREITTPLALQDKRVPYKKVIGSCPAGIDPSTPQGNTNTKTSTATTPENTTTAPISTVDITFAPQNYQNLSYLLDQIPAAEHCSRLVSAIEAALTANDEGYVMSNIEYCLAKHKPMNGDNSLGGMVVTALSNDYAKAFRIKAANKVAAKAGIAEERRKYEVEEKCRIEAKTAEAEEWCETEEGRRFKIMLLADDTLRNLGLGKLRKD